MRGRRLAFFVRNWEVVGKGVGVGVRGRGRVWGCGGVLTVSTGMFFVVGVRMSDCGVLWLLQ